MKTFNFLLPLSVQEDLENGDTASLDDWLSKPGTADINRIYVLRWGRPLLVWTAEGIITPVKVDVARFLLARGADVNKVLAAGSYGAYLHEQRKRVLTLRELANLGRAATADPVLNFLVKFCDNGVVWNVLSHWPSPRC